MLLYYILEVFIITLLSVGAASETHAQSIFRVTGYYAGWMQGWYNNGRLPAQQIDFSTVNYVIHFGLVPNSDGSVDFSSNSIQPSNSDLLLNSAHNAGAKVLICIGGWGSDASFRSATSPWEVLLFVNSIIQFVVDHGYDGVDVDWEVLEESDSTQYLNFIKMLRNSLNVIKPGSILTAAAAWQPQIMASAQRYLDQINLMTYDLSGPWNGWVSWYNSPVYSGNYTFPDNGKPLPSIDSMVRQFIAAGIPKEKISVGIDLYGYLWQGGDGTNTGGVSGPRQSWSDAPNVIPNIPYYEIMDKYFKPVYYRWDSVAAASYLQIDTTCNSNDMFISYDDEKSCKAAVEYAKEQGLGGVFIWELGAGVASNNTQPMMNSIKAAVIGVDAVPSVPVVYSPPADANIPVLLSWYPSGEAKDYNLQVSTDSNFSSVVIDSVFGTASSAKLQNLQHDQKYFWRVNAFNESGSSGYTMPLPFITLGPSLSAPSLNLPKDKDRNVPVNLTFSWASSLNAGFYQVQIAASPDFCELVFDTTVTGDTSFTFRGLEYNNIYYWRVRAIPQKSSYTISDYSETRVFTTTNYPPAVPEITSPLNESDDVTFNPTLSWRQTAYASYYEVKLSLNSGFTNLIFDSSKIYQTNIKVSSLQPNTVYYWEVKAFNAAGAGDWSEAAKFKTGSSGNSPLLNGGPPGEFELMQNYPNPFNNNTVIEFGLPVESSVQILISDSLGRIVKTFSFSPLNAGVFDFTLYEKQLASGVYFYTIVAKPLKQKISNYVLTKKMVLLK